MKKTNSTRTAPRKAYMRPAASTIDLSDDNISLLATSTGTFEDMGNGGDLGGDSGNNSIEDMEWGGNLGTTVTGGN
ncbi:MAG: hypothetical protein J6I31_03900 [Prevotella sp.]|nr:hypothetical protein [Prevotella sp.]